MKIKYFAWIRELTKNDEEYLDSNEIQNILGYISKSEVVHKDDMVKI